jgi:hypothetical protein
MLPEGAADCTGELFPMNREIRQIREPEFSLSRGSGISRLKVFFKTEHGAGISVHDG